jgi:hypothetical protein
MGVQLLLSRWSLEGHDHSTLTGQSVLWRLESSAKTFEGCRLMVRGLSAA